MYLLHNWYVNHFWFDQGLLQVVKNCIHIFIACWVLYMCVKQYPKHWYCLLLEEEIAKNYIGISFLLYSCYICWYLYKPSTLLHNHSACCLVSCHWSVSWPEYSPFRKIHCDTHIVMCQSLRYYFYLFSFFFSFVCLFLRESLHLRARTSGVGAEGGGYRGSEAGRAQTHELWDHDLSWSQDAQPTEPPRCPYFSFLKAM